MTASGDGLESLWVGTLDLVLVGLLVVSAVRGFWRGLFVEVMAVVSVVAATAAGLVLAHTVGAWVAARVPLPEPVTNGIGFSVVFFVVVALVRILRALAERFLTGLGESRFNSIGGLFFGTFKAALVLGAVIAVLRSPVSGKNQAYDSQASRSVLAPLATVRKTIDQSTVAVGLSKLSVGFFSWFGDVDEFTATLTRVDRP